MSKDKLASPPVPKAMAIRVDELSTREQVRTELDESEEADLLQSVKTHGVLQPIGVYKDGSEWVVAFGHRRLAAAINAGLEYIPAFEVPKPAHAYLRQIQLIENIQRAGMSLLDTSKAVRDVYDEAEAPKVENTAKALSRSKPWVSKMLLVSSPTRATTVSRRLMAADKISDIEMAYTMCQIEEIDPAAAVEAEKAIDTHTRATLKKVLAKSRKAAKENTPGEGAGEGGDAVDDGADDEPIREEWDFEILEFARRLVADAVVKPADLERKKALEIFLAAEQQFLLAEQDGK